MATLAQLAEHGFAGLSVDAVARRAGVARTTIYRHWASPSELAVDALDQMNRQPTPSLDDCDPTARVAILLHHLHEALEDPLVAGCMCALMDGARRDPALRELLAAFSSRRRAALVAAIAAGIASEAFRVCDPVAAAHALAGSAFYTRLVAPGQSQETTVAQIMEAVLGVTDPLLPTPHSSRHATASAATKTGRSE